MILSGSDSQALAAELAAETGETLGNVSYDCFADGELIVQVPDLTGERAVVVAATATSESHLELLQLQDAAREAGAEEIITVLPYMGYARQDEAFKPGHPISARAVAKAVSTGTDRVLTVNPHEPEITEFFDVPAEAVDAAPRLAEPLPALTDPVFLSPDEGATHIAAAVRNAYGGGETDHFVKDRDYDSGEVAIEPNDTDVSGRDVVVVDDIIATGSTMSESISVLKEAGPARVFVACIHPLLAANAQTKLARAGVEAVYGTDTLDRSVSDVTVAPALAAALD